MYFVVLLNGKNNEPMLLYNNDDYKKLYRHLLDKEIMITDSDKKHYQMIYDIPNIAYVNAPALSDTKRLWKAFNIKQMMCEPILLIIDVDADFVPIAKTVLNKVNYNELLEYSMLL